MVAAWIPSSEIRAVSVSTDRIGSVSNRLSQEQSSPTKANRTIDFIVCIIPVFFLELIIASIIQQGLKGHVKPEYKGSGLRDLSGIGGEIAVIDIELRIIPGPFGPGQQVVGREMGRKGAESLGHKALGHLVFKEYLLQTDIGGILQ